MKKLNLAIIGQGRSGKDIHGNYFIDKKNVYYNVRYVVEQDARRREVSKTRYPSCETLCDYTELFDKTDVDVVVNAAYSDQHYGITKDLLLHGFNVVVDKPFSKTYEQCKELMSIAKERNLVLAVFQQSFYAPYYEHSLSVVKEKRIGEILEVSIRYNALARRWDWQTLQKRVGGNSYNTGPHPFGMALGLLDFDPNAYVAYSKLAHTQMSSGDYDDFCKVIITAPGKPLIDIEISNVDAYNEGMVKIQGTCGTYKLNTTEYAMKYMAAGDNVDRPVQENFIQADDGSPIYCSEKLITREESGNFNGTAFDVGTRRFYEDLYACIADGKEMSVTAEMAARVIQIIEKIHIDNPIEKKYN